MRSIYGLVLGLTVATSVVVGYLWVPSTAFAYNNSSNTSCRWPYSGGTGSFNVVWKFATGGTAPTGIYATAYNNARVNWDGSSTPVNFANVTGQSAFQWQAAYNGLNGVFGTFSGSCPGNVFASGTLTLNRSELDGPWPDNWWKQWTASHEIGHQIALGHTDGLAPFVGGGYIYVGGTMTASPDSGPPSGPNGARPDDQCAVNQLYVGTLYPPTTPCGY